MGRYCLISSLVGLLFLSFACQPDLLPAIGDSETDGSAQTIPDVTNTTATAQFTAALPSSPTARIVPGDVTRVDIQISWPGGETPILPMTRDGSAFGLTIGDLPANVDCAVHAWAYGAQDKLLYEGQVTALFPADIVTKVVVSLVALDNAINEGAAPRIVAVRRPATPVQIGNIVDLEFTVGDANDQELSFKLESPGGSFSAPAGKINLVNGTGTLQVQYTAPEVGGVTPITIKVTDDAGLAANFSFTINAVAQAVDSTPTEAGASVNFPPVIESITAVPNGRGINVYAVTSDDGTNTGLSYRWVRAGLITSTNNPLFLPANSGVVPIGLTVTDSQGASSSLSFDLDTAGTVIWHLPIDNNPPVIVAAIQSANDVSYGDVIDLTLHASDPDAEALTAEWTTDKGTLEKGAGQISGDKTIFKNRWHADVTAGTALVTVKVRDPRLAWVAYVFRINQVLGRVNITANAGADREELLGTTAQLDGSASTSEDGAISSYEWTQVSGPASTIDNPAAAVSSVQFSAIGTYTYRLTVRNVNNSATDDIRIVVTDPRAFMFEAAEMTDQGVIFFLNRADRKLHRYDMVSGTFLPPWPTRADVRTMAVAPEGNKVYVGYLGGAIDQFDGSSGERTYFASSADTALSMAVVGKWLFVMDRVGGSATYSTFNRATGVRGATSSPGYYYSSAYLGVARTLSRVFHFRDGISPNDIHRVDINQATGALSNMTESPYHGGYSFMPPIRFFPDETKVIVGSGSIFSTADLTTAGSFGKSYVDLAFDGPNAHLVSKTGTKAEVNIYDTNLGIQAVKYFDGDPLRVFIYQDTFVLITKQAERMIAVQVAALPLQ